MSRSISDCCVAPSARDEEARRERQQQRLGVRLAVERGDRAGERDAEHGEERRRSPTRDPERRVACRRSLSVLRWISAAPSARSEKTITRLANTSASAARPYSSGVSRRATAIADDRARDLEADLGRADPDEAARARARGGPGRLGGRCDIAADSRAAGRRRAWTVGQARARATRLYGDGHVRHRRRLPARRRRRSGAPRARPARDDRRHRLPRPRRRRLRVRRRLLARRAPALDHRRRGRPPAVRERARPRLGAPRTARSTTTTRCATGSQRARPRAAQPLRHRGPPAPLRGARARRWPSACAACSPSRSGTSDARRGVLIRDRLGIKPLYYAIAGDVVVFGSELKCVLASGLVERRARPRGDRRLPDARLRARAR